MKFACCAAAWAGCVMLLVGSAHAADPWLPEALAAWKPGMVMIHEGRREDGLAWILARQREQPDDVCGHYLAALLYLNYSLGHEDEEQRDELAAAHLDESLGQEVSLDDPAARFCKGALHGLRAAERVENGGFLGAAFDGKKMRRTMLDLLEEQPSCTDCKFWLGVYDYYAAVLPRYAKVFRSLLFLPSGDRERGIAELEEAAQQGLFENYSAYWVLTSVYADEGQLDKRRDVLQRFHEAYPDDVNVATELAFNYEESDPRETGRGTEMLRELIQRLKKRDGDHIRARLRDAHYGLGNLLSRTYRYEEAVHELYQAMELADGDMAQVRRIAGRLITSLNFCGRHKEAVEVFLDLEKQHPDAQLANLRRSTFEFDEPTSEMEHVLIPARRLVWEGETEKAEAEYKRLLGEYEDAAQIHFWMAEMYYRLEQWVQAEARYNKVAAIAPERPAFTAPFTQIRLGQICDLTGRRRDAVKHYRQAKATAGDYDRYERAAERFIKKKYSRP